MKKELFQEIEIPEGVEVVIEGSTLKVRGKEGENKKTFKVNKLKFEKKDNKIVIGYEKATKKEKKLMNTLTSHVKNMIRGAQKKFEYQLKVCFSHFPINVEVKGKEVLIKNFLGEKIPRKTKISEGVEIEINKDIIKLTSIDKELVGQAAANFETATKIRKRDRRIFQDGIFIINKAGRVL